MRVKGKNWEFESSLWCGGPGHGHTSRITYPHISLAIDATRGAIALNTVASEFIVESFVLK